MINYTLAKEIYGLTPWCVDIHTLPAMTSILRDVRNGVSFETSQERLNTPFIYDTKSETRLITRPFGDGWTPGQLENNDDFDGIGVINLNGAITVGGGASSMGMEQLSEIMMAMYKDERVKSFIIPVNSGGGSSAAVEIMSDTINLIKQTKPVRAVIKKGGTCCSAAYGIVSACTSIYSDGEMNVVGSIGTMIQFDGRESNTTSKDGVKHVRLYATKSINKNKAFEEALNNDNYSLIINELLDPVNDTFIKNIESNRPIITKATGYDTGSTLFSKNAIGTYIDGIATYNEVLSLCVSDIKKQENTNININNSTMNKSELQSKHPELYNEVLQEGILAERDRVGSFMAHSNTDLQAVQEGIESGLPLSNTQREKFLVKANNQRDLAELENGAPNINATTSTTTPKSAEELAKEVDAKELAELEKALNL